jgi:hypothetical protein
MTQAEIEAEVTSLRARLSQLEQEQDFRKKDWARLGLVSLCVALVFLATSVAFCAIDLWFHKSSPDPLALAFLMVIAPLAILTRALWDSTTSRDDEPIPPHAINRA